MAQTTRILDDGTADTTATERVLDVVPISKALRSVTVSLDRTGFTDAGTEFVCRAEYRLPRQAEWRFWGGFMARGGGDTSTPSAFSTSLLPPSGSTLRIRVRTNGPVLKQALSLVEVD